MHQYISVELSKRTMKAKALAIAGALSVVSIAVPQSAKAQDLAPDEFWYAFSSGAFAQLCELHMNDIISTEIVQVGQKNYMEGEGDFAAKKLAIDAILANEVFKDCPLLRY